MTEEFFTKSLKLEIITPEKVFFSGNIRMVNLPGEEGEFGVLCGHMNLISKITNGLLTMFDERNHISDKIFVGEGFAEITHTTVTMLVENAINLKDCNFDQFSQEIVFLKEQLNFCKNEFEKIIISKKISYNEAILSLL